MNETLGIPAQVTSGKICQNLINFYGLVIQLVWVFVRSDCQIWMQVDKWKGFKGKLKHANLDIHDRLKDDRFGFVIRISEGIEAGKLEGELAGIHRVSCSICDCYPDALQLPHARWSSEIVWPSMLAEWPFVPEPIWHGQESYRDTLARSGYMCRYLNVEHFAIMIHVSKTGNVMPFLLGPRLASHDSGSTSESSAMKRAVSLCAHLLIAHNTQSLAYRIA